MIFELEKPKLVPLFVRSGLELIVRPKFDYVLINYREHNFETINYADLTELVQDLIGQKNSLENINLTRGYILSTNIFSKIHYPIVANYAEKFLDPGL